jgi:FAD/FMN-containing dehydrogenase
MSTAKQEIKSGDFAGPALRPGDDGYDAETLGYNLTLTHHPALVVGATSVSDVVAAVRHARDHGLAVAVQATGHGVAVPADGAVLINTRRLTGVWIDPATRTARVEAGTTWARVVRDAALHGLAPLNGSAPGVGVVGYVLGGGLAMLGREYGFAADHVRAIDLVTADGGGGGNGSGSPPVRHVTAETEPDLFWAVRGAKGNFGVAVSVALELVPVASLYGGGLYFGADDAAAVLRAYRDWVRDVPEAMGSSVMMIRLPDLPALPEPVRGKYVCHVRIAYTGRAADGERMIAPLRAAGRPIMDTVRVMPYREVGSIHHEPTVPVPFSSQVSLLRELDVDAVLAIGGPDAGTPHFVELRHLGGAMSRPPAIANAVGGRDAAFTLYTGAVGATAELRAAHTASHARVRPSATGGTLYNFLGTEATAADVERAFTPEAFARLRTLKRRYDPDNVFRINHNIPPAA